MWLRAAEGSAATAKHAASKIWQAELADVEREIAKLRQRVEKLEEEVG
jgi:ubiquinone biosynthesis protein UbiJ